MRADTTIRDAWAIAEAAFVRVYPLVTGRRAMALATAVSAPDPATMRAPLNTLVHGRDTPDTLRSSAWLDLADEPLVLTVPDTRGRYYALWLRDAWSDVFASVGARTTGTWSGAFALLGPRHHACALPQGLTPIAAPTRTVHLGGRLEAVGERPGEDLRWAYDGFRVVPLSQLRGPVDAGPSVPMLRDATPLPIEDMDAAAFFAEVMRLAEQEPPDLEVRVVLGRLRELVEREPLAPGLAVGLARGRAAVHAEAQRLRPLTRSGWMVDSGASPRGVDYVARAAAAHVGRDADPAADTVAGTPRHRRGRPAAVERPPVCAALRSGRPTTRGRLLGADRLRRRSRPRSLVRRPARPGARPGRCVGRSRPARTAGPRAALELAADTGWRLHAGAAAVLAAG